jgi:predicted transcriptional regulator
VAKGAVLRSRFGARVTTLLVEIKMTSEELSTRSALSTGRIEKILTGRLVRITLRNMTTIASVWV